MIGHTDHLMIKLQFWRYEGCAVTLHCYYSQVHSDSDEVAPVRIPSMDQIDLLKNYSYLIELLRNDNKKM